MIRRFPLKAGAPVASGFRQTIVMPSASDASAAADDDWVDLIPHFRFYTPDTPLADGFLRGPIGDVGTASLQTDWSADINMRPGRKITHVEIDLTFNVTAVGATPSWGVMLIVSDAVALTLTFGQVNGTGIGVATILDRYTINPAIVVGGIYGNFDVRFITNRAAGNFVLRKLRALVPPA